MSVSGEVGRPFATLRVIGTDDVILSEAKNLKRLYGKASQYR